jgi:phosphate transport system protein
MTVETRIEYQADLAALESRALETIDLAVKALEQAVEACENQDIELASHVVADDDRIDGRYLDIHQSLLNLVALQAPVATDLRIISALLHVMKCIERIGDQCVNIAKLVPVAGSDPPVDETMLGIIGEMGRNVGSLLRQSRHAFAERDVALAQDLVRQDDVVDNLNREAFRRAIEVGDDVDRREWAMTMMLAARALERMGDNAVDIGEQVAFVVTGLFREFDDASHP